MARRLGLVQAGQAREVHLDAAPLDELDAVMLEVRIPCGSRLHGAHVGELRLPPTVTVSLVVRDGQGFTPQRDTRLLEGDQLLVITPETVRAATERRIRAVDRAGTLARWFGESGR